MLPSQSTEKATQVHWPNRAQELYETSNSATINFGKAVQANRVARLGWKPLGQNEVRLEQLRRIGEQLELLGETAGVDYRMRAESLLSTTGEHYRCVSLYPRSTEATGPSPTATQKNRNRSASARSRSS